MDDLQRRRGLLFPNTLLEVAAGLTTSVAQEVSDSVGVWKEGGSLRPVPSPARGQPRRTAGSSRSAGHQPLIPSATSAAAFLAKELSASTESVPYPASVCP